MLAARTILVQLHPLRVILTVLGSCISPLLTLSAGEGNDYSGITFFSHIYSIILVTEPAPTVLPPSRIAKRRPGSIATG